MAHSDKALVCRRCNVGPETILVDGRPDRIVCPSCRREMDLDEALRRAGRYLSHSIIKGFQNRQIRSTRRYKHVKYKPGRLPAVPAPDFIFK